MGGATWKNIVVNENVFFQTGNDILQLFKVSAKKFKKKGPIVYTLISAESSERANILHIPYLDVSSWSFKG